MLSERLQLKLFLEPSAHFELEALIQTEQMRANIKTPMATSFCSSTRDGVIFSAIMGA